MVAAPKEGTYSSMKWLVVGDGQLGSALSLRLREVGFYYKTTSKSTLDITNLDQCKNQIEDFRPDVVVNTAAWTNVDTAESNFQMANAVNCDGSRNLALASSLINATFVQISTDFVFSGESKIPWDELCSPNPRNMYGLTKANGEKAVLDLYSHKTYLMRTAWLYSQFGTNFAKKILRQAIFHDRKIKVVTNQVGQPTSAMDLADRIIDTVELELPFGIYHCTNSGAASWNTFANEIMQICDFPTDRIEAIETNVLKSRVERPRYTVLSHNAWHVKHNLAGFKLAPMRDWREASREIIPKVLRAVREEV